jgi:putative restriction endonuclease
MSTTPLTFAEGELLTSLRAIRPWRRGKQRAPHKPLLLLWMLARLQSKGASSERLIAFSDLDRPIRDLLQEFCPTSKSQHPEYPFWRLQRDNIWEVRCEGTPRARKSNTDPLPSELRRTAARGGFTTTVHELLRGNPRLVVRAARLLLDEHFLDTDPEVVAKAVGLDLR